MRECPKCKGKLKKAGTRLLATGDKRRILQCTNCGKYTSEPLLHGSDEVHITLEFKKNPTPERIEELAKSYEVSIEDIRRTLNKHGIKTTPKGC